MRTRAPAPEAGRIGPNAATQLIAALEARGETQALERLFVETGLQNWLREPPQQMIAAHDAARLHVGLRNLLPAARATAALEEAGRLTGAYLLAHRIPGVAQAVLKLAPRRLAGKALTRAISAHAWTFVGDGRFETEGAQVRIYDNPLCEGLLTPGPACIWHAAVLKTLFHALVSETTVVTERECRAAGDPCCRFEISI